MNEPELEVVFAGNVSCLDSIIGLHLLHPREYFAVSRLFKLEFLADDEDNGVTALEEWPHHVVDPAGLAAVKELCSTSL